MYPFYDQVFAGFQIALLLIRHGADVDIEDKEGYTVLGRANDEIRPLLIDAAKAMLEG
jgi:26S proteasome non-ATPase regulatory subunit 10